MLCRESYKGFKIEFGPGDKVVLIRAPDGRLLNQIDNFHFTGRDKLRALAHLVIDDELGE
jgi:hypothetical protein